MLYCPIPHEPSLSNRPVYIYLFFLFTPTIFTSLPIPACLCGGSYSSPTALIWTSFLFRCASFIFFWLRTTHEHIQKNIYYLRLLISASICTMSSAVAKPVIPRLFPRVFHSWVGNGRILKGLEPYERFPIVSYLNSIYNTAPLFKWSLSIVPLYGIFVGTPSVEKIDFNSSAALLATGIVWFIYALLIQPQNSGSRSLALVNICLATVNGYNCYRSAMYHRSKPAAVEARKTIA